MKLLACKLLDNFWLIEVLPDVPPVSFYSLFQDMIFSQFFQL